MEASDTRTVKGYDLLEQLGEGAYGIVYRARQRFIDRDVAIKVILPQYANQPDFIRRFEAEAQLVAQLEHLHIVPLYDYWRDPDGAYLVMRLMKGGSLEGSIAQDGPWETREAARLVDQVASALEAAHQKGVVHRDLKPANILLDEQGNAYLSDFGIAKAIGGQAGLTATGAIIGTPAYISPEQAQSLGVSAQSDIYALGVVLYELLVGEHPFPDSPTAALLLKHVSEPLPLVREGRPELPAEVDQVIQKATAKDPNARYPDALALAADFHRALHLPVELPEVPEGELHNPYKGLRPFLEADAGDFFGREALIEQLLARLSETDEYSRFLAVVGPSGSGKSSVVKAGLLPVLREGALPGSRDWFIASMTPGRHLLEELEIALLRIAANPNLQLSEQLKRDGRGLLRAARLVLPGEADQLLLVVDQFEEVFTLAEDPAEAKHFMDLITQAVTDTGSCVRVLVTLRADFYDRPLMEPHFCTLVQGRTEVVLPLTTEELQDAIRCPAEHAGAVLEEGLVTQIVADVADQPGALPLLQYALTELFEKREGRLLTQEAYQSIGGVLGALGKRAEAVYRELDQALKPLTRQVFLRLVTLGEGVEDTRRRVLRQELESLPVSVETQLDPHQGVSVETQHPPNGDRAASLQQPVETVIESFGRARLLSFDHDPTTRSPTVEVAHEALLREWPRLRDWLDQSRADVRMERVLGNAADEWLAAEEDPSFLLRGARLDQFAAWSETTDLALTQVERDYLEASLAERRVRQAAEAERQAHEAVLERRSRNFLRGLVAVMGIAMIIALVLSLYAFNQQRTAQHSAATATIAQGQAQVEAATAVAAQQEAQIQAGRADQAAADAQAQKAIAEGEARASLEAYSLSLAANAQQALDAKDPVTALALAMAANRIANPPLEAQRILLEAAYAPGPRHRFNSYEISEIRSSEVFSLDISPDGGTALVGDRDRLLWLDLDTISTDKQIWSFELAISEAHFMQDGKTALIGLVPGEQILWDLIAGEELHRFEGHNSGFHLHSSVMDISVDERYAVSGGGNEIVLWEINTGREIRRFDLDPLITSESQLSAITGLVFSPDGYTVIGSFNSSQDTNFFLEGYIRPEKVEGQSYLVIWDVDSGELINYFSGSSIIRDVDLTPDGKLALIASDSGLVELWDLETGQVIHTFEGHDLQVLSVEISPDGQRALSGSSDGEVILWDLVNREAIAHLKAHTASIFDVAFGPYGQIALSTTFDGSLVLWDLVPEHSINQFASHTPAISDITISPDGKYLLSSTGFNPLTSGEEQYVLHLWDIQSGELTRTFAGHSAPILGIDISPDNRLAVSASADGTLKLWDLETGEEIRTFTGHRDQVTGTAFNPDGGTLASSSRDMSLIQWEVDSGEQIQIIYATPEIEGLHGLDFSPDGQRLVSAAEDGIFTWDLETGRYTQHITRLAAESVAFSPDGRSVLSTSKTNGVYLWDAETGEEILHLDTLEVINRAAISPDGRTALLGAEKGTVMLWDLGSGQVLRRFNGHNGHAVQGVAFSPDGEFAFTAGEDGRLVQWRLDTPSLDELLEWIENNRYVRELNCEERAIYSVEPLCE